MIIGSDFMKISYCCLGQIDDFITSLYIISNPEYIKRRMKNYGFQYDNTLDDPINFLKENSENRIEDINLYFNEEAPISWGFLKDEEMFNFSSIESMISYISALTENNIKERFIDNLLEKKDIRISNEKTSKIMENNIEFLKLIKTINISDSTKWNVFCFLDDIKEYKVKFVELLNSHLAVFKQISERYSKDIEKTKNHLEDMIKNQGTEYLNKIYNNTVNLLEIDELYICPEFISPYTLAYHVIENKCYLLVGLNYEESVKKFFGEDEIEKNLLILRNISDRTRFEIIKMLLESKCYGLEIANNLGITTATVSHHMNYLSMCNMVTLERKDRKIFYTLNMETIKNAFKFLSSQIDL